MQFSSKMLGIIDQCLTGLPRTGLEYQGRPFKACEALDLGHKLVLKATFLCFLSNIIDT